MGDLAIKIVHRSQNILERYLAVSHRLTQVGQKMWKRKIQRKKRDIYLLITCLNIDGRS